MRRKLALKSGDRVVFEETSAGIVVLKDKPRTLVDLRGIARPPGRLPEGTVEEWIQEAREARAKRIT